MSKYMKKENLKYFADGMFYSKLIYCLPLFGNVIGLEEYKEDNSRHQSFTAKDNQKLQVLQNKLCRLLLRARYDTPTETLLNQTNSLSVQQMIGYHTALLAHKIVKAGKPSYLNEKLKKRNISTALRESQGSFVQRKTKLAITREGFVYRGVALLNKLSEGLRNEEKIERFKSGLRKWVVQHIPVKPITKFLRFGERLVPREITPLLNVEQQDIRRFLTDRSTHNTREAPTPTDRPPPPLASTSPDLSPSRRQGILRYFRYTLTKSSLLQRDSSSDKADQD